MYCGYCGAELPNSASFCPHCGKRLVMQDTHTDNLNELVEKARAGNEDAFSDLYEQTYSKVYYTVKSMVKDEDAVFDILQDSYIKAFTHLDSFEGNTQFLPWVKQIAANTARDWLKRQKPLLFSELNHNDESESPVEERFVDDRQTNIPEQVIDQAETKRLIQEIIDELPDDQRAAIGMYYYEEMSVREIAEAMGATENAVKSRLLYGRRKIEKKALWSRSDPIPPAALPQPKGVCFRDSGYGSSGQRPERTSLLRLWHKRLHILQCDKGRKQSSCQGERIHRRICRRIDCRKNSLDRCCFRIRHYCRNIRHSETIQPQRSDTICCLRSGIRSRNTRRCVRVH